MLISKILLIGIFCLSHNFDFLLGVIFSFSIMIGNGKRYYRSSNSYKLNRFRHKLDTPVLITCYATKGKNNLSHFTKLCAITIT